MREQGGSMWQGEEGREEGKEREREEKKRHWKSNNVLTIN